MENLIRKYLVKNPNTAIAIKVISFLSWIGYIIIASANNVLIEAYLFSIGITVVSYFIFSKKAPLNPKAFSNNRNSQSFDERSTDNHYLSVFFTSPSRLVGE
jgi:hypothetical protein